MEDDFMALIGAETEVITEKKPEITEREIAPVDPLDPAPVVALFDLYHSQIDEMKEMAQQVTVSDEPSNKAAVEMTTQIKGLVNKLEKERKKVKEPYLNVTSLLDNKVKDLRNRLDDIQKNLNKKIMDFMIEEQRKAQEVERVNEKARARAQAVIDAQARETGELPLQVVMPEVKPVTAFTDSGKAALKTKKDWRVIDFRVLPEELFVDRATDIIKAIAPWINAQMKAGITSIPGIDFFETTELKTTVKR